MPHDLILELGRFHPPWLFDTTISSIALAGLQGRREGTYLDSKRCKHALNHLRTLSMSPFLHIASMTFLDLLMVFP